MAREQQEGGRCSHEIAPAPQGAQRPAKQNAVVFEKLVGEEMVAAALPEGPTMCVPQAGFTGNRGRKLSNPFGAVISYRRLRSNGT